MHYNPDLFTFMTYHRVCNRTCATCGTGTATSGALEFTPCVSGVRAVLSLVFCAMFWRSLFVVLSIVLSVTFLEIVVCSSVHCIVCNLPRLTTSNYHFGIF
jgi:hypothetical protein